MNTSQTSAAEPQLVFPACQDITKKVLIIDSILWHCQQCGIDSFW